MSDVLVSALILVAIEGVLVWIGGLRLAIRRTTQLILVVVGISLASAILGLHVGAALYLIAGALVAVFDPASGRRRRKSRMTP